MKSNKWEWEAHKDDLLQDNQFNRQAIESFLRKIYDGPIVNYDQLKDNISNRQAFYDCFCVILTMGLS